MEIGSEEERGWNPLGITKQMRGKPQITLESPKALVGEAWRRKESKCVVKGRSKGFIPRGIRHVRWRDQTCLVRLGFPDLELVPKNLAIYNLVDRP
jgi:hypothetical protein